MVTLRTIESHALLVSAHASSPKCHEAATAGGYELVVYWASLARQYRLRGACEWVSASSLRELYSSAPLRGRVWDRLHEELPQSSVVPDRASFTQRFEQLAGDPIMASPNAAPAPGAGYLRLFADVVEVQTLDLQQRLHDRHRFERRADGWAHALLVP